MNTEKNISKFQKFKTEVINRKNIKIATYNPRTIGKANYEILKKNLKRIGLIETLVWNKRTGNLISGHQRLKILDQLEKRDDYDLTVAVVDLDLTAEKEQNLFMNNQKAMGDWDRDLIMDIVPEINIENAGFTKIDLSIIGVEFDLDRHDDNEIHKIIEEFEQTKELSKKEHQQDMKADKPEWKNVKKNIKENYDKKNREDYFVVTFDNADNKEIFLNKFGFRNDERYIKGEVLLQIINDMLN